MILHAGTKSFFVLCGHDISAPLLVLLVRHIIQLEVQVPTQCRILLQLHFLLHLFSGEANLIVQSLILVVHIPRLPLTHGCLIAMSYVLLHELSLLVFYLLLLVEFVLIFMVLLLLRFVMYIVGLGGLYLVLQVLQHALHDVQVLLFLAGEGDVLVVLGQIVGYLVEVLAY